MADLEDIAKTAPPEEKPQNSDENIEERVSQNNEEKSLVQTIKSFNLKDWLTVGATTTLGFLYGGGLLNLAASLGTSTLGYTWAKRNRLHKKELKSELYTSGLTLPVWWGYLQALNRYIPNPLTRTIAGWAIGAPLFIPMFWSLRYLFNNYTPKTAVKNLFKLPKDIYEKGIKPNFIESLKRGLKFSAFTLPTNYLIFKNVPLRYQLPLFSLRNFITGTYRKRLELKQAERKGILASTNGNNYGAKPAYGAT